MKKLYKTYAEAVSAADKEHPHGYYGVGAISKLTCEECGHEYYGFIGSRYNTPPMCSCGVNDMWRVDDVHMTQQTLKNLGITKRQ